MDGKQRLIVVRRGARFASGGRTEEIVLNLPRFLGLDLMNRRAVALLHVHVREEIRTDAVNIGIAERVNRDVVIVGLNRRPLGDIVGLLSQQRKFDECKDKYSQDRSQHRRT